MPSSSSRAFSPPMSTVSSSQGNQSPVQIKKVVIEGRSKHDGASIKMYLKLSVAVDSVSPGASIPLFREDNIRIIQSKVHPLDDRSVPYFYSSSEQPLLHKAAAALQLGPKSSRPYHALFPASSPPMDPVHASSSRRNRENVVTTPTPPPTDERYTGFILVSGYHVTLVLPKEFPPRAQPSGMGAESDGDDGFVKEIPSSWSTRSARRSSSIFHKTYLHMMAGLEVFVPYVTTPPKGPFLVSIPVPRCLDNHVKLRISTPAVNTSPNMPRGSFTSASSEDDTPGWDFLTEPPVSRKLDKATRKSPYQQSADDEHSDSHSGPSMPGTELIQGAYQSTDVLHVRWAPPTGRRSGAAKTEDGMRRVGVERTVGKMRCEVLGRDSQGVKLGITYDGVCTGLWHPGVATMLGMDIALDAKGRRISWADEDSAGWAVSGGNGFGGLYSEAPQPSGGSSRRPSFESNSSIPFLPTLTSRPSNPSRSSASLLRAPLPNENTPDYSFENSPGSTPPPTTPASGATSAFLFNTPGHDLKLSKPDVSPGKSITLKVNLLKLLPPAQNAFNFNIKGVIVVDSEEEDFIPLPAFRVLGSDKEKVDTVVALQTPDSTIQLGTQAVDGPRRTLRLGEEVRCDDTVGLLLGPQQEQSPAPSSSTTTPAKHRTPPRAQAHTISPRIKIESAEVSDAPSALPSHLRCVLTTVTPLPSSAQHTHCVSVNIPSYEMDTDVLEFGLALPQRMAAPVPAVTAIEVLYARYAGRYVPAEVLSRRTDGQSPTLSGFDSVRENHAVGEIQFWAVVHLEEVEADVGDVEVVYLVGEGEKSDVSKGKAREEVAVDVLLPCFQQPVARYTVEVDCPAEFDPQVKHSTLANQHTAQSNALKLTHFVLPARFFPVLSLSLLPSPELAVKRSRARRATGAALRTLPYLVALALLYLVISIGSEVRQVRDMFTQMYMGGVPYTGAFWADGTNPAGNMWWWDQSATLQSMTAGVTATTSTTVVERVTTTVSSWEKETVTPVTPTVNLADATPVREKRPSQPTATRNDRTRMALIPLPAVPLLSWHFSTETKEMLLKGLRKALHLLRRIIDFPLDPD